MKRLKSLLVIFLVISWINGGDTGHLTARSKSTSKAIKALAPKYKKWITEEISYIITKWEKKVFLQLESDRERDMLIAAFWKNRDPNPLSPENEYKEEHYKRLKYANERFGKGTPGPGWRTERGRIHIILGEPHSINRYEHETEIYPTIIWFYQGLVDYGLPNAFSVVFFKEDNSGDYELYSPVKHGPHKLLVHYLDDPNDSLRAYNKLMQIEPNVAKVSMSLIEGEPIMSTRPTMTSEILISKQIVEAPIKRVNDAYAKKLLKYKKFIDVDYSVNYVASAANVRVLRDNTSGFFFVHYLVEPKKLSLEQHDNTFYGNLEVNGSVVDEQGETVYQFSKSVPIKLNPGQMENVKAKLFSFQDYFPLIPGTYHLDILIRNTVSKEFTSIERKIVIPRVTAPKMGSVVVANKIKKSPRAHKSDRPYLINGVQMRVSPRNDFTSGDTLYLFFQVFALTADQVQKGHIVYTIFKDEKPVHTSQKAIKGYPDRDNFFAEFSLSGLPAAYYSIRASVYGSPDQFLFQGEADFYISPISHLNRPWVVSATSPTNITDNLNTIAIQYANKKDFKTSLSYLERAYNLAPLSGTLALNYCRVLLQLKRYRKIKTVALPFLNTQYKNKFLSFLGFASAALGEYMEAITHFKGYLAYYGTNIKILNAVGQCYHNLGNTEEAMVAWKKSLDLFPDQEKLKAFIKGLKKSKRKTNK